MWRDQRNVNAGSSPGRCRILQSQLYEGATCALETARSCVKPGDSSLKWPACSVVGAGGQGVEVLAECRSSVTTPVNEFDGMRLGMHQSSSVDKDDSSEGDDFGKHIRKKIPGRAR